jgi:hypothetical protein
MTNHQPQVGDLWRCSNAYNNYVVLILEKIYRNWDKTGYLCLRLDTDRQVTLSFTNDEWVYTLEA